MVSSTPYTDSNIRGLLSQIMDPEIPVVSIEEMGMLREIRVNDSGCDVYITPTYTACPAMGIIAHDIKAMLHHHV